MDEDTVFFVYYVSTILSTLGWLWVSLLTPNKFIWLMSIPSIIFIVVVNTYIFTEGYCNNKKD